MNGHWFCFHCDDVVTLPLPYGRWDVRHGVQCPVCRHLTANWINHTLPMKTDDLEFLQWIYTRLQYQHGENVKSDYMIKLAEIAQIPESKRVNADFAAESFAEMRKAIE